MSDGVDTGSTPATDALLARASDAFNSQNYAEAATFWLLAADRGSPVAEYELGRMHDKGLGFAQDFAEARARYRKAAGQGYPAAMYQLALLVYAGLGDAPDIEEALRLMQEAANRGSPDAEKWLAGFKPDGSAPDAKNSKNMPQPSIDWRLKARTAAAAIVLLAGGYYGVRYFGEGYSGGAVSAALEAVAGIADCRAGLDEAAAQESSHRLKQNVDTLLLEKGYPAHPINIRETSGLSARIIAHAYLVTSNPDLPTDAKILEEGTSQSGQPYMKVSCVDSPSTAGYIVGERDLKELKLRQSMMETMYKGYNPVSRTLPFAYSDPNPPVIGHAVANQPFYLASAPASSSSVFEWNVYKNERLEILKGNDTLPYGWVFVGTVRSAGNVKGFARTEFLSETK